MSATTPPAGWQRVPIGTVCKVVPGFAFKSKDWKDHGIPVIKIKNIRSDHSVDCNEVDCVPEHIYTPKLVKFVLKDDDFLIAMTGATAGKVGRLRTDRPMLLNQRVAKFDPFGIDRRFFWAVISGHDYERRFFHLADGAAQPNMSGSQIERLEIPLPPLPAQRRIASILSAYDDLIEKNTRRIAILEEMARRLYEEWFVHFRFPGHQEGHFEGDLPAGWKIGCPADIASFISRGITPIYDDGADCRIINQKCIRNQRLNMKPSRCQSKKVPNEKVVRFGDVLINSTGVGTLGRVAQVCEPLENCTVDSHVTIVRPRETVDLNFFGLTLFKMEDHFEAQGVGATGQTELGRARIAEAELNLPPEHLQKRFGEIIRPARLMCVALAKTNTNLRAQRDLLLPKLISGEIDVSEMGEPKMEAAE